METSRKVIGEPKGICLKCVFSGKQRNLSVIKRKKKVFFAFPCFLQRSFSLLLLIFPPPPHFPSSSFSLLLLISPPPPHFSSSFALLLLISLLLNSLLRLNYPYHSPSPIPSSFPSSSISLFIFPPPSRFPPRMLTCYH